ncbi:MAG: DUF1848 domain-containing protein [Spirochaetes bacterium]|nr:DUF1848 domain-containing protein [Spirochaetota bacterium]
MQKNNACGMIIRTHLETLILPMQQLNGTAKIIISASRRTDISAFYSEWFFHRLKEGSAIVTNPFNPTKKRVISLHPHAVACIVFWTRNPAPLLEKISLLDSYPYYFLITINSYGKSLEPHVPAAEEITPTIARIASLIGSERIIWRYDPILLTDEIDKNYHYRNFEKIATMMCGLTHRCIISFFQNYKKSMQNLLPLNPHTLSKETKLEIISHLVQIASKRGIALQWCAPDEDITASDCNRAGIHLGGCIDGVLVEKLSGIGNWKKDSGQRRTCLCAQSIDIGAYNTCVHGCRYCYATTNHSTAQRFFQNFNYMSSMLDMR